MGWSAGRERRLGRVGRLPSPSLVTRSERNRGDRPSRRPFAVGTHRWNRLMGPVWNSDRGVTIQ
jgi:hypothetical protein